MGVSAEYLQQFHQIKRALGDIGGTSFLLGEGVAITLPDGVEARALALSRDQKSGGLLVVYQSDKERFGTIPLDDLRGNDSPGLSHAA